MLTNRSTSWVRNLALITACLTGCGNDTDPVGGLGGTSAQGLGGTTGVGGTGNAMDLGGNSADGGIGTMVVGGTGQSIGGATDAAGSGAQDIGGATNVDGSGARSGAGTIEGGGSGQALGGAPDAGGSGVQTLGGTSNAGGTSQQNPGGATGTGGNGAQTFGGNSIAVGTDAGATCASSDVKFKSISVGLDHTCGVTTAGAVRCWGANDHGQLGDDTTETREFLPQQDVLTNVRVVAAGNGFTCALTTAGGVRCWGDNTDGQLGLGQIAVSILSPPLVDVLTDVQSIAAANNHVCALMNAGGVRCWGGNYYGQLGDGTSVARSTPPPSDILVGVKAISAGGDATCALMETGGVRCWGTYVSTSCPNGTHSCRTTWQTTPPASDFLSDVQSVAAGDSKNSYAVHSNGDVEYWQGASITSSVVLSGVEAVASAGTISCALMTNGSVRCWGSANSWSNLTCYDRVSETYYQCGGGSSITSTIGSSPAQASDLLSGAAAIAVGMSHACALMPSGGVQCWGNNQSGQLGDGSGIDKYIQYVPAVSDVFTGAQAIALGTKHTCALTSSGGVRCWGRNFEGQLGDGTLYYSDKPPPTDVIADVQAIAAGSLHTCVLTTAGGVRCWGDNTKGQLGDGTTTSRGSPPTSDAISGVRAIHANNAHTCVILVDGGLRCWGDGVLTPPTQDIIGGVAAVTSSSEHSCALMETGGVRCWGQNGSGQLGDGTTTATTAPPATDVLTGVRAVVAGEYFTCALTVAGGLRCWGRGASGMSGALGMEYDYADHYVPPDTDVLDGIQGLSLGRRNGCVLTNAGAIRCWGDFYSGLRGDGYNRDWSTAERITGEVLTGAQVVVMGEGHTCALTISGGVRCWGDGSEGQLGDGRANYRAAPVWVTGTCRQ